MSNKFTEDELKPIIEKVGGLIKDKGGKITLTEEWGKKRLAYPIKNFSHAYYVLAEFDFEGEKVEDINRGLRMMSEIMRHQIVSKTVKTAEDIKKEKEISQKITARKEKEKTEEVKKEKKIKKEKVDMGELDEKLDKILETDDLL
ncbi:MAG: 30S ribosomal protein S6 [Actinobacteria bacterium]|nr:30S ribosomal protein S6 [Actinomycetota bacterium]